MAAVAVMTSFGEGGIRAIKPLTGTLIMELFANVAIRSYSIGKPNVSGLPTNMSNNDGWPYAETPSVR